ncbi:diguanylate cyclase domain-containing protein [Acaryochloris sp. CCMEE 5410]|uniref:diguanylate cyclase domain-containing protein n=1 Tax=Acaryochloris sp. CCMEE 5410 TaxID=310037 RepID=UPI000248404F|nr:diguanylate cyclase [Acaryochloris sp. CCMEE 5410]KAI9135339.1 GGDEF domain-containing protein [Acaryochloris sp. CCMEE 5410]
MSFQPPFYSNDLSEPTDSFEPLQQPKAFALKSLPLKLWQTLQPKRLYRQVKQRWTRKSVVQVSLRSHFDTRLDSIWQRLEQDRQPLSLFLCEVDDFDRLRRQYGDSACNTYIGQVIKVIQANIERSTDMLARYHGDTFAVLLPQTSIDEAACIAKKIRLRVKALKDSPTSPLPDQAITLSLGIATIVPTPKLSPVNFIAAAEQSLRQAQRAGGNRVILQEGGR